MIRLLAKLDASGTRVLCGRCGSEIGRVRDGRLVLAEVWMRDDHGTWYMTERGRREFASGRRLHNRRPVRMGPPDTWHRKPIDPSTPGSQLVHPSTYVRELPALAKCPGCRAVNRLEAGPLRLCP